MKKIIFKTIILCCIYNVDAQQIDLSLKQCRDMAVQNSEAMKIARCQNEQTKIEKQLATTAALPKFSGSATYAYIYGNMEIGLPEMDMKLPMEGMGMEIDMGGMIPQRVDMKLNTNIYMFGVNVQQPIFAGGKIITGNKMAKKGMEITEENIHLTRMNVIAEAEKAYWNYFLVKDKIKLLKQYEQLLDTLYQSISNMIAVQMLPESELLKISSRKSNIQYQTQKAANGMELVRMQLCRIIGVELNTQITLTDSLSENEYNTTITHNSDVATRPEYRILQKQVELKTLNIQNVRGDYLPTLGVMAGYNYMGKMSMGDISIRMKEPMPLVMVSLSIPIFHFGEGAKKIKSAKIARDIQQQELNKNSKLLSIEIQYAKRNLEDAFLLIGTAETALKQAEANLKRSQDNYETGMGTLLDVLDAQTQWQEAHSNAIEARVEYKLKEIDYLKAIGNND
ncbi:MAG: TolC family protein [Bacteroidales bacterium]|jgi:outer membrane protein TolC|nr:TolC family protein [Bacteroidales bacterium]